MSKHIQKVEDLIKKAIRNGEVKDGPYRAKSNYNDSLESDKSVYLYHYGTLIFHARNNQIVELGGYSFSDRDAISTAASTLGIRINITGSSAVAKKAGYKPQNGWYIQ